jgi:diguanylate cyclase (GGDEF)-like protein
VFRKKILIVDDSDFFAKVIENMLIPADYNVVRASSGEDGLRLVREEKPDLVLLDIVMPDMNGFEVCRILRESESNNLMPIIMLTAQNDQEDKLIGLELGADDYIVKPFNNRELLSRIKNTLRRIDRNRDANPLTGLPGNLEIQRELNYRIDNKLPFAAIYADLDNFKAYNDVYGFLNGDIAIKMTADILRDHIRDSVDHDFIGHIGGDDFIMILTPDYVDCYCRKIIENFDRRIRAIYTPADLERGHIITQNRHGEMTVFPIMTISLAVVTNENRTFSTHLQVSEIAAELKKKAKSTSGSCFIQDTRVQA